MSSALSNREGQRVPSVTFRTREENQWVDVQSDDIFKGRRVIVFSLPGAFTPTCSSTHLPRFNELAPAFFKRGIDEILCLSVNDAFVMNAWAADQESENVRLIPDGNGEFTDKMGMLVDKAKLGFGKRSWRYSMLVDDGVIEKMFIEPQVEGDPFEVSDADTMLHYLDPEAKAPQFFSLLTRVGCPHCVRAKKLLDDHELPYETIDISRNPSSRTLLAVSGRTTVPQIFTEGQHIGGADDLEAWLEARRTVKAG